MWLPAMRKYDDDPCFCVWQEFCARPWSSFWHEIRVLCFFVFSWVGRFFSYLFLLVVSANARVIYRLICYSVKRAYSTTIAYIDILANNHILVK